MNHPDWILICPVNPLSTAVGKPELGILPKDLLSRVRVLEPRSRLLYLAVAMVRQSSANLLNLQTGHFGRTQHLNISRDVAVDELMRK